MPGAAEYALPVTVVNESDGDAILYGWIDFDRDGLFSAEEAAASVIVPSAPGVQTVVLRFAVPAGADFSPGETFLRLRLTTDALGLHARARRTPPPSAPLRTARSRTGCCRSQPYSPILRSIKRPTAAH